MKTVEAQFFSIVIMVAGIKRETDLFIIRLTNLKPFAELQNIIIRMAN